MEGHVGYLKNLSRAVLGRSINYDEMYAKFHMLNSGASIGAITPNVSLQMTAVFAAVKLLSESMAMLPLSLYKKTGDKTEQAQDHTLHKLLKYRPNNEVNIFSFKQSFVASMLLQGSAYIHKGMNIYGDTVELNVLLPQYVYKERINGKIYYNYTDKNGSRKLTFEEVINIPYFTLNGIDGLSPIGVCRKSVGLGLKAESHAEFYYDNGGKPNGFIKVPQPLTDLAYGRMKNSFNENYGGSNSFKTGILEGGADYVGIPLNMKDAQFIESRKFQVSEIARIFSVPPHKIGDLEKATFSNIEEQNIEFATTSIIPFATKIEEALNFHLLTAQERESGYYFKFNTSAILRGNEEAQNKSFALGRQWGWLNVNEIRALKELNPIDGGDTYLSPLNMTDITNPTQGGTPNA